jgi:hypothetical protein
MRTLVAVLLVLCVIIIISTLMSDKSTLSSIKDATLQSIVEPAKLSSGNNANSSNYTYSMWLYIDDWNYKYGKEKVILSRTDSSLKPSPKISLGAFNNDLTVSIQTYPETSTITSQTNNCTIKNVPIQTWTNVLVSVNGRVLDIYLDGKLVKTCVLPGVVKLAPTAPLYVTPGGGFAGYTSNIQFWNNSSNPQEAWDIYAKGYNGGGLKGLIGLSNKYNVKVAFYKDEREAASLKI